MTRRRDFIKKSLTGTAGIALTGMGYPHRAGASSTLPDQQKDWHTDPEWSRIKYGDWGGPGVSAGPGPMDEILVKDYAPRSSVVTRETFIAKPKYPAVDCHVHVVARTPSDITDWVRTMDEVGMETSVVLTGATGKAFDDLVELLPKKYPGRFLLYCGMDRSDFENPDYPRRAVAELVRCYEMGARGVGEISDKGYGITRETNLPRSRRLHPDDSRLDPFWEKCAELKMPVNLHMADHPSCWTPLDVYQERTPDYQHFNQFSKDVPSFDELIAIRNRTLEKHKKTIFIACHLGNQGHDLDLLSREMDKYPNLFLDTSARDYEMGRTPRSSAKFLTKYKGRIVFGTDMGRQKSMYQVHWRLLESEDEYFTGRVGWRYYGLALPAPVLKSLYRDTAKKLFNF
jgi:predicted TIM-barrel fold metal-dependent hydrolase